MSKLMARTATKTKAEKAPVKAGSKALAKPSKAKSKAGAKKRTGPRSPGLIDEHVGSRMRLRRAVLGMSQEDLSSKLGITFQQVQKYERGFNRMSASRLHDLSNALGVEVNFFFEGFDPENPKRAYGVAEGGNDKFSWLEEDEGDLMERKETVELIRAYYQVQDEIVRRSFMKMLKALIDAQHA
jgi:transcriptional regulator with XRE-family HTH domain